MARAGSTLAEWWVDRYTRGLPCEVRERRRAEIASDVFEQRHTIDEPGHGLAWRTVRGLHADVAWRREERRLMQASHRPPSRLHATWGVVTQSWFAPLALLVAAFDLLLAIAVATEADGKMPGRVIGPVVLVALATLVVGGLWLRYRLGTVTDGRPRDGSAPRPVPAWTVALVCGVLVVLCALLVVGVSSGSGAVFVSGFAVVAVVVMITVAVVVVRACGRATRGAGWCSPTA